MLNFNSALLSSENPSVLSDFYQQVFQKEADWSGGNFKGFLAGCGMLLIGPHDKVHGRNQNPERIILNFETEDVKGDFERIRNLSGASVIAEPYHPSESPEMWLTTLADPDGNYFQLSSPIKIP